MFTREVENELTVETVTHMIDNMVLSSDHTLQDIERACEEAAHVGFASICLAPYTISYAARLLRGSSVAICGTVGIPLGSSGIRAKCDEVRTSVEGGASEIDMVINLVAMKSGRYADVQQEIAAVRKLATGLVLKVTLECCYLADMEKARACKLAIEAGANIIKTSTGFGKTGATVRDVHLLKQVSNGHAAIEAAGDITKFKQFLDLMKVGATRMATPAGGELLKDFFKWEAE